ncbi:hypothetical protein ES703_66976 [subsurface metagenome]
MKVEMAANLSRIQGRALCWSQLSGPKTKVQALFQRSAMSLRMS